MSDDDDPKPILSMFTNEAEGWAVDPQMIPFMLTVPFTENNKNPGHHPYAKPYTAEPSPLVPMAADPEPAVSGIWRRLGLIWARVFAGRPNVIVAGPGTVIAADEVPTGEPPEVI